MNFHLGRPIIVLATVAILTGGAIALRVAPDRTQLTLWTFVDSHARSYRESSARFAITNHTSVRINLVNVSAENIRLGVMFDRNALDPDQPDVVEIEIGTVGRYFRGNRNDVPLLPLNQFLDRDGWRKRIAQSRLSPWSKDGDVFGLPHDVHPVSICYRKDLFDEAGVDLASAQTWPDFQARCLQFQSYWRDHGYPRRSAIELPSNAADDLVMMLLQRHINLLDDHDQIHLADPKVADTVAFYAQLVAGNRAIGADATPGGELWARDFANGEVCALITPDWRAGFLRRFGETASGKVAMMSLPRFDPADAPTATWGGTMAAIPRRCRDPQAAWKLIIFLYSDRQSVEPRWRETMTLPAIKDLWTAPVFHESDPFFGNQKVGELYIDLAEKIPPHYWSAFTPIANAQLTSVLSRAITRVRRGEAGNDLIAEIQRTLNDESLDLRRRIDFGKFE